MRFCPHVSERVRRYGRDTERDGARAGHPVDRCLVPVSKACSHVAADPGDALTDAVLRLLRSMGWEVATEISFNMRGDRGTIDILAFHAATGSLLVIEIKSVVPDL